MHNFVGICYSWVTALYHTGTVTDSGLTKVARTARSWSVWLSMRPGLAHKRRSKWMNDRDLSLHGLGGTEMEGREALHGEVERSHLVFQVTRCEEFVVWLNNRNHHRWPTYSIGE